MLDLKEWKTRFSDMDLRQMKLSELTSFRIGGEATVAFPTTPARLRDLLIKSKEWDIKIRILGAGTNVLAPDEGVADLVVCTRALDGVEYPDKNIIRAGAGMTLTRLAILAAGRELTGLEFAHGIPGTVGGGVYMNAGAYGGEIGKVCIGAHVMDADGNLTYMDSTALDFSYRHSALEATALTVVSADFLLAPGSAREIKSQMQLLMEKRKASQPLNLPSAGSAFKRPKEGYAAAMIDEADLKGYQIGGAMVSTKHAGFVVNAGGATAADVKALLHDVAQKVYDRTGIMLETEVRLW